MRYTTVPAFDTHTQVSLAPLCVFCCDCTRKAHPHHMYIYEWHIHRQKDRCVSLLHHQSLGPRSAAAARGVLFSELCAVYRSDFLRSVRYAPLAQSDSQYRSKLADVIHQARAICMGLTRFISQCAMANAAGQKILFEVLLMRWRRRRRRVFPPNALLAEGGSLAHFCIFTQVEYCVEGLKEVNMDEFNGVCSE
jgi:hypothetical protein